MRSLIGVIGGFLLAQSFMAGSAAAIAAAGWMPRVDATITAGMLAFLVWMAAILAAFSAASAWRAAAWGLGSAVAFGLLAWSFLHG